MCTCVHVYMCTYIHVCACVCAQPNTAHCHLGQHATDMFASVMVAYGNCELCSKFLFNVVGRDYIGLLKGCYSMTQEKKVVATATTNYSEKDGEHIKKSPPLGDSVQDMYDAAASSNKKPWCMSDHDRHVQETQSDKCDSMSEQDHTFQLRKNYQSKLGVMAVWALLLPLEKLPRLCWSLPQRPKTSDMRHNSC